MASSHVASHYPGDVSGWWEWAVGPNRPPDTNRFFVVCVNNFGSCFGSTGPLTVKPLTGNPFAVEFPFPSIADIVFFQRELQQALDIPQWHTVIGGSLGGMAALEWAARFPDKVGNVVCLNAGAKLSHIGRGLMDAQADMIKMGGTAGLKIARRLATLSYVGEGYFRQLEKGDPAWQMPDWLSSEAEEFAMRFDQFSYLGFLSAMQTFDCSPVCLSERLRVIVVGCAEDILFPPDPL